jgi:hypothetical protein
MGHLLRPQNTRRCCRGKYNEWGYKSDGKSAVTDVVREREGVTGLRDVIMKMECIVHQFAVIATSPGK